VTQASVIAVTSDCVPTSMHIRQIVAAVLEGSASAGSRTRHFVLCRQGVIPTDPSTGGCEVVIGRRAMTALSRDLAAADHVVIGAVGEALTPGTVFAEFVECCYENTKWVTFAEFAGEEGAEVHVGPSADFKDMKIAVAARPVRRENRGLIIVEPPCPTPEHTDPFCENAFFVLEELERVLGFMPVGRILSTGLFDAPIEHNPILHKQALEMGQRLVTGEIAAGRKP